MRTDTEIRIEGMGALLKALGEVDAERFVALIGREPFDYTEWRQRLWLDIDVESLSRAAMERRTSKP